MGVYQNTIDLAKLQRLGLTERESKIYIALVSRGPVLPKQIPALTPIPRAKIYETLYRLLDLGLITERHLEKKKYYEAVPPDDAIQHLLASGEAEMEARRQAAEQIQGQLMAMFYASRSGPNAQDYFKFLQNPTQIRRAVDDLQRGLQQEALWFNKPPYAMGEPINHGELEALRRGVKYRGIYELDRSPGCEGMLRCEIQPHVDAGEEARVHAELAVKLAIFDRRVSMVRFVDQQLPEHLTTILIDNRGIANAFAACFEFYWQQSLPFEEFLQQSARSAAHV